MNISIVGSGYVGLTTAIGLAGDDCKVICIDTDKDKVEQINRGKSPFYEVGLENRLAKCINGRGNLKASSDFNEILDSEITFICVGTPCDSNGNIDLSCIKNSAREIGQILVWSNKHPVIVVRSTVTPGTTEKVVIPILEEFSGKKVSHDFSVAYNPEFLQEGRALQDFTNPDRIIIGEHDPRAGNILEKLYHDFTAPIIRTDIKTAEMIKYASNAFLATKISFINEIGNICKYLGIDVYKVAKAIGHDHRIGNKFLNAGIGFGGPCLPKDLSALICKGSDLGYKAELLQSVLYVNLEQPVRLVEIVRKKLGNLENKVIAVLGLAFKPNTDDVRQAPALQIILQLLAKGATVKVYDPMVRSGIKLRVSEDVEFCDNTSNTIAGSDCVIIATEWDEFKNESLYEGKVVIDGRRALDPDKVRQICQDYEGICW